MTQEKPAKPLFQILTWSKKQQAWKHVFGQTLQFFFQHFVPEPSSVFSVAPFLTDVVLDTALSLQ